MILFLDATTDVYSLALATREGKMLRIKKIVRDERIGDRVFRIVRAWTKKKQFSGIVAVTGPGRFSGIRHSIVIANTLAYAWGIPLYGAVKKEKETPRQLLARALRQKSSSLLIPHYGQEPNITPPPFPFAPEAHPPLEDRRRMG